MPQIDPRLAVVWRSPEALQFGAPRARAVLERPSQVDLDLIRLLRRGVRRETLEAVADGLDAEPGSIDALLAAVAPALAEEPQPTASVSGRSADGPAPAGSARTGSASAGSTVVVAGTGPAVTALRTGIRLLGYRVPSWPGASGDQDEAGTAAPSGPAEPTLPRLVLLVGERVIAPDDHLPLIRRDLPHLPVVFGDDAATVGPLVVPGETACLRCIHLSRRDSDAAWPAIAAQLADQPAAQRPARTELEAAIAAMRMADDLLAGRAVDDGVARVIPYDGSKPDRLRHRPHPECGCRALEGTGTAPGPLAVHRRGEPSSERAGAALA